MGGGGGLATEEPLLRAWENDRLTNEKVLQEKGGDEGRG